MLHKSFTPPLRMVTVFSRLTNKLILDHNMKIFSSIFLIIFAISGCGSDRNNSSKSPQPKPIPSEQIAVPKFDGKKAFNFLKEQTDFGPRVPGSVSHSKCLNYLNIQMAKFADKVNRQEFSHKGYDGNILKLTNIFSSFNVKANTRILLLAHWDSRPRSDQDPDIRKRSLPVLGANDGASGVAVLMEIARQLKLKQPAIGIDILFTDGEDYGKEADTKNYLLGAQYFANNLPADYKPVFGILLDMVGDAQLELLKERYSIGYAPNIVDLIWNTAHDLGITQFRDDVQNWVTDDHLPLNNAGIPTIDIIDFNYPDESNRYWHTTQDTPDKCSAESLEAVGQVLLNVIYTYRK
ncbi:MAG: M28 family peptidase [Ignavibacteriales bacterium]|nr:M28 family peptidase [Ignavibacteriales bacterium]